MSTDAVSAPQPETIAPELRDLMADAIRQQKEARDLMTAADGAVTFTWAHIVSKYRLGKADRVDEHGVIHRVSPDAAAEAERKMATPNGGDGGGDG